MDVLSEIAKPVIQVLMVPVKKHLGYLVSPAKYVRDMCIKMSELNATKLGVKEHINRNTSSRLEVPDQAKDWPEEVGKINSKVQKIPTNVGSCFNLKSRHTLGRKAFKMIEEIDSVMRQHSLIIWTDAPVPLGRVDSMKASTSTLPLTDHNDCQFQSRERTFTEALIALGPNQKSHMIALCGMGGVGKTTMMHELKKVIKQKKMFDYIVEAVIGQKTDPDAIQKGVAEYLGVDLKETTKPARADKLRKWFKANSSGGKTKILIILDDVWELVDMSDIGLSPLPNQGVDFKVLLTSRDRHVCTKMGVEANLILNVKVLTPVEGQSFFRQFVKDSDDDDADMDYAFKEIGDSIASRCQGLPIAIKTIAYNLKGRSKYAWEDALSRLDHHDIDKVVHEVFEISYNNLQDDETKSIFLLCGLFPEDFDIPTEELVRYGWGLELLKKVFTIKDARNRINTCIDKLIYTNLLIESDDGGCVKMHDLARAFVLNMFSEHEHASIVNHGSMSEWPENDISNSYCKRISLTCKDMSEFPSGLMFPNLLVLKLMHRHEDLRFPEDFYREMENLQIISYDQMRNPLLPSSSDLCSTNLTVLHLHRCELMNFDFSCVGDMLNLEVLSFSNSNFQCLPSVVGNLKKLRLLDLTNCHGLRIEKGVFKNLVKLEELYARVSRVARLTNVALLVFMGLKYEDNFGITITDDNFNEIVERSANLYALEFEFHENNAQPKNMSFEKLQRFKITMGCFLDRDYSDNMQSYENTLQLGASKGEIVESKMNEVFEKTEVLHITVPDLNHLGDLVAKTSHLQRPSSFNNIRVLVVIGCLQLKYLFTVDIAKALSKLEELKVTSCFVMEELIHTESSGEETVTFPKLKLLSLCLLSRLSSLCQNAIILKFPSLKIADIDNCKSLEHIFTYPTLESLTKLQELKITICTELKVIVKQEHGEQTMQASKAVVLPPLKSIELFNLPNLVGFFIGTNGFQWPLLDDVTIEDCPQMLEFTSRHQSS